MRAPYLTMVTYTRNDTYGGGIIERLQLSLDVLVEQMETHGIESELILVEWNPPADMPRLKEVLRLPGRSRSLSIRLFTVPAEIHQRYRDADRHPLHGAVAFNAALRRARGKFIVTRVSDIIWSEEVLRRIAGRDLDENTKYRCTRVDVDAGILRHPRRDAAAMLAYCRGHRTMIMHKIPYYVRGLPRLRLNSDGDFQLLGTEQHRRLRGYQETDSVNSPYVDGLLEHCAYAAGIADELWADTHIYKIEQPASYKHRTLGSLVPGYDRVRRFLPGSVPGPFLIRLARMTGLARLLYDRRVVTIRGIEIPTRDEYYRQCRRIVAGEEPFILNGPDWGLNRDILPEESLLTADWERSK